LAINQQPILTGYAIAKQEEAEERDKRNYEEPVSFLN
jgi:hypothetical protein